MLSAAILCVVVSAEPTADDIKKAMAVATAAVTKDVDAKIAEKESLIADIRKGKASIKVNGKPASRSQQISALKQEIATLEADKLKRIADGDVPDLPVSSEMMPGTIGMLTVSADGAAVTHRLASKLPNGCAVFDVTSETIVADRGRLRRFASGRGLVIVSGVDVSMHAVGDVIHLHSIPMYVSDREEWEDAEGRRLKLPVLHAIKRER